MCADKTKIEWTDATWNPINGCTRVDEGCRNCYAEIMAARFSTPGQWGHGLAQIVGQPGSRDHRWTGKVRFNEAALTQPLRWTRPRRIFVNSTSDMFHESVPDEWIDKLFAVMALCPQHTFQVLTKRPDRAAKYLGHSGTCIPVGIRQTAALLGQKDPGPLPIALPNVWLGTSISDQASADLRIPHLLATPAAIRFISAEPLLGPVDLTRWMGVQHSRDNNLSDPETRAAIETMIRVARAKFRAEHGNHGIDWAIVGGESGPGARPMHHDWARSLRNQCVAAGVSYFHKQNGEWAPYDQITDEDGEALYHPAPADHPDASLRCKYDSLCLSVDGTSYPTGKAGGYHTAPAGAFFKNGDMSMFRIGKKAAGRLLDGREWNEMPEVQQ